MRLSKWCAISWLMCWDAAERLKLSFYCVAPCVKHEGRLSCIFCLSSSDKQSANLRMLYFFCHPRTSKAQIRECYTFFVILGLDPRILLLMLDSRVFAREWQDGVKILALSARACIPLVFARGRLTRMMTVEEREDSRERENSFQNFQFATPPLF